MEANNIHFPDEISHLARVSAILEEALQKSEESVGRLEQE